MAEKEAKAIKYLNEFIEELQCDINMLGFEDDCEEEKNLLVEQRDNFKTILNMLETTELSNKKLKYKLNQEKQCKQYTEQLENIVKFAITNHIGNLRGGMQIERYGIDKMQDLRLSIDYQQEFNGYIIRVSY